MDTSKLDPILKKESTLKTASARELQQAPQDVLERYTTYALTHIPLGDTTKQLTNLRRVIAQNKTCAVGTIVGPYGYGKTSTAVHLWNELRQQQILAIPPFLWGNLPELMDAVYYWIRFEFSQGPKAFIPQLDDAHNSYRQSELNEWREKLGAEEAQQLVDKGRLLLDIRPEDIVGFFSKACNVCEQAGYQGMTVFTDELQATLAAYRPSRDQFFADLFAIVKDILGRAGNWAWVISTDDDTEGYIARLRADLLQRLQRSALYFRVRDVYSRREYPSELWAAFEERFGFDGSEVILAETLDAIGQVAARSDLGAGPRMVTNILSLAVKHYQKTLTPYAPVQFVDDFLAGQVLFDQRGKFVSAVKKALDNPEVRASGPFQRVVKLLCAYPIGCSEETLSRFDLLDAFRSFPPLARQELVLRQSGGYILRYLAEEEAPPEQIEQRLTKEFVQRYAPGRNYAVHAAIGFMHQVLLEPAFSGWKREKSYSLPVDGVEYQVELLRGTFDSHYPDRLVALLVAAVPQSSPPQWQKPIDDADIEIRFEMNYAIAAGEPSRLVVSSKTPNIAAFQLNLNTYDPEAVNKILPDFLHDYYAIEQLTPLLALALIEYLYKNRGDLPDDQNRVSTVIAPLRQYVLSVLMSERIDTDPQGFTSTMVGLEKIKDLFRQQCRLLYPTYQTLITNRRWKEDIQQYIYALERVISEDGISIVRGRRSWKTTKEAVADAFHIPKRSLTRLETLLNTLDDFIVREEFSGRLPSSEVTLRFELHPLEEEWLGRLEESREKVRREGIEVPAMPAELLIREARRSGYTLDEVQEIMRLLQARKFVDYDPRKKLLIRTMDDITDLREAVERQIDTVEHQVQVLTQMPEFEPDRYPTAKWRSMLAEAKERDEIELLRTEVRGYASNLSSFAASRLALSSNKLQQEQNDLHELTRQGIPAWLGQEFLDSPLSDLLERQRHDLAAAYQATLEEIRQLRDASIRGTHELSGIGPEAVIRVYNALINLSRQARVLRTRLQSYEDRREDLDAWRQVSREAAELDMMVQSAQQVYGDESFGAVVKHLWEDLTKRFEAQPLSILDMHKDAARSVEDEVQKVSSWLESRREDFERQCQAYREALAEAGIKVALNIPFDQEHPTESYSALSQSVVDLAKEYCGELLQNLRSLQQVVRYGIRVQQMSLSDTEVRVHKALDQVLDIERQLAPETLEGLECFRQGTLARLIELTSATRRLAEEAQQAIQPRPPEGTEVRLMKLLAESSSRQSIDLRGLVTRLLDQGEEEVDLEALMQDLQSLFQKNQISIHISLLHSNH